MQTILYNAYYYILLNMNNLILIRHGQSIWNLEKRFTGWMDVDLTDNGKSEARYAGQLIKESNIKYYKLGQLEISNFSQKSSMILKDRNGMPTDFII